MHGGNVRSSGTGQPTNGQLGSEMLLYIESEQVNHQRLLMVQWSQWEPLNDKELRQG